VKLHPSTAGDLITRDELVRRAGVDIAILIRRLDADLERLTGSQVVSIALRDNRPFERLEVAITAAAIEPPS
jgi:hypothetical protein